jgi:hypothetical protein
MPSKSGICIGGPLAGQHRTECGSFFSVMTEPPTNLLIAKEPAPSVSYNFTALTYLYHEVEFDGEVIGLWIPSGGTVAWAIREALETYSMYEDLNQ